MAQRTTKGTRAGKRSAPATTLSVDVGASHVKAYVLDERGEPLSERARVDTPEGLTAKKLVRLVAELARELPPFDRVSVGLPGIVHRGIVYALPIAGGRRFRHAALAAALERELGRPVRLMNDGEMHGLGVIRRQGVELVLTLGTGLGTALYVDGELGPRIQIVAPPHAREPIGGAYGNAARKRLGGKRWSKRVHALIESLRNITNFDRCYVGGGNADRLKGDLPRDVRRIDNSAAAVGGVRLWQWDVVS